MSDCTPAPSRAKQIQPMRWLLGALLSLTASVLAAAEPAVVDTVRVEERRWQQTVPLYGTLTSPRDADVMPRIAGLVETVAVDAGDRVSAGDTLIELDRALSRLDLDTLQASADEAQAELEEARRLLREADRLAGRGAVSQSELEARRSQVAVRAAALQRLRAEVAAQRERLARHTLIAPFDGVVRARLVDPGEYVAQTTPAISLVATDTLRLDVSAPQQYFGLIEPGMRVQIEPEAPVGEPVVGTVDVIVGASDAAARSFLVRVFVDNSDGALTPGMSAKALLELETPEGVLIAPRDALVRVPGGGTRMWLVNEDDDGTPRAIKRQVSLGRSANNDVEVLDGLEPGDRVVVRGNESLDAGQAVRVREARQLPPADTVSPPPNNESRSLRLSQPGA
ncbi:Secretion protein HlyD [Salinisphaera shabanensis E1L3A]|uniref:Secretion protein HlyD n=1 Tax=Salinisphaera shabanensis E1L3A TaxID=1033802 RepID=U2ELW9_9GAMM|nr:efflux RND transporter periplasmic adaptor subunit [Salinisphaera shabanensis]ERJ19182.1 Secretion protein HlyD [Salinisphaera shabanensis E1L3A]